MKLIKNITLVFTAFLILSACNKEDKKPSTPSDFVIPESLQKASRTFTESSNSYGNYVVIKCMQLANQTNRENSYDISAYAKFTTNGVLVNTGPITINNRIIGVNPDTLYEYTYRDSTLTEGKSLMGNNINVFAISGEPPPNDSPTDRNKIMIVPKEIFPSSMPLPQSTVNRSLSFPLTWNPDPTNQFQKVNIEVSYYKGISQYHAANMPNSIPSLFYQVPDNGSFTIPQSDLSRFPQGAYISISISRAWIDNTAGNITYVSIVEAHTIPLLVTDNSVLSADFSVDGSTVDGIIRTTAIVNGGVTPYTYSWRKSTNGTTWGTPYSTSSSAITYGPCTGTSGFVFIRLVATDALGATKTVDKKITYRCNR